jgi:hypothetical protein
MLLFLEFIPSIFFFGLFPYIFGLTPILGALFVYIFWFANTILFVGILNLYIFLGLLVSLVCNFVCMFILIICFTWFAIIILFVYLLYAGSPRADL